MASDKIKCPGCPKQLAPTNNGKFRRHTDGGGAPCDYGGTVIPMEDTCNESPPSAGTPDASSAESSGDDAPAPVQSATSSTASSPNSPEPADDASTASAHPALPGVTEYTEELEDLASSQLAQYRARVEANLTPFSQPAPTEENQLPLFSQPAGRLSEEPARDMSDLGKSITSWVKELFYQYSNRRTEDNRSAQVTMGPSEMGTECDRRLALSIMRMPAVNPGGDNWASFVGTCIHSGLEEMFLWANHGTGRFAVEQRLEFDHEIVPKGTSDLIDRTAFMVIDHKAQGRWSRNKLKSRGPSQTYRVQAHVYAKGARARGERVDYVAIISWPRDESTLEDLYVWTEPYRPDIADGAFARVDDIAAEVSRRQAEVREIYPDAEELEVNARVGASFQIKEDCRFCSFYLPNSRDPLRGCSGKR